MAIVQVTVSELNSAAAKIAQANETFREAAAALKLAADELGETWEGDSQKVFMQEQTEIDNWYKLMADIVDTYADSMKQAAQEYETTDQNAAAYISKG